MNNLIKMIIDNKIYAKHFFNIVKQSLIAILSAPLKSIILITLIIFLLRIETKLFFKVSKVSKSLEEYGYYSANITNIINDHMTEVRSTVALHDNGLESYNIESEDDLSYASRMYAGIEHTEIIKGVTFNDISRVLMFLIGKKGKDIIASVKFSPDTQEIKIILSKPDGIPEKFSDSIKNLEPLLHDVAEYILQLQDPFLLGHYYAISRQFNKIDDLAYELRTTNSDNKRLALSLFLEGLSWFKQHEYERALATWDMMQAPYSNNIILLFHQGQALIKLNNYEDSIKKYQKILDKDPHNPSAINQYGIALYNAGSVQQALHKFTKVTHLVPSNAEAQKNLSKAFLTLNKYIEGFNAIKKAFMLDRYDPELYFMLLKALSQQPHERLAYEKLLNEIHHNPEYSEIKNTIQKKNIIDIHNGESEHKDSNKKFKIFNQFILKNPNMCNILFQALGDISPSFKFLLSCQKNGN